MGGILAGDKNWTQYLVEIDERAKILYRAAPEPMMKAQALVKSVHGDGALSAKVKELLALAMGVQAGCEPCIAHHVRMLIRLGADRAEILDACGVFIQMGGGPGQARAAEVLQAFDQIMAANKAVQI